jgi:multidrug transporter EmrE-like cation transporter
MNQIEKYFNAEKYESVLFVFVGLVAIGFATYFFIKVKQPFYNGMAYPLIAVALIQIVVGSTVYFRSPKDIARVSQMVQTEKAKIQSEEIPRMETVM